MEETWRYWINEPIYEYETGIQIGKRKHLLREFCLQGLLPLVKHAGYVFQCSDGKLVKQVLLLLFYKSRGKKVVPKPILSDSPYEVEQYFHFHYNLDTRTWLDFWDTWGGIQDFQEGSFGYDLRFQMSEFVWSWLNLEMSPAAIDFEKEIEEDLYEEEMSKGKEDPYLQDTLRRDYQDRHWF